MVDWRRLFGAGARARWPSGPDDQLIYAVGDVHGCERLLASLLNLIASDIDDMRADGVAADAVVVFLGDYIDRGPNSRAVLEILSGDDLPGASVRFLLGNHEDVLLKFVRAEDDDTARHYGERWVSYGGLATLASYGVAAPPPGVKGEGIWRGVQEELNRALPDEHLAFLEGLELMVAYGDFVFVHAGVKPGLLLDEQDREDLLWIRDEFLYDDGPLEKVIVHGHTPESTPTFTSRRVGLDTGAYATGLLTAARIWRDSVEFLQVSST